MKSVTQTSDGGFVATGYTSGNAFDIFVLKTNSIGDSLWSQTFDGYGDYDQGNSIIETSDGNVIVVGEIHSRSIDTLIAKLSFDGNTVIQYGQIFI